jgi:VIT1/CCC1 family predicted Fe2+/Mn2+ transporter
VLVPFAWLTVAVIATSLLLLGVLGALGAYLGGAPLVRATLRVLVWGAIAMGVTALVGRLCGVATA